MRSLLSCSGFCIGKGPVFESDGKDMPGVSGCCLYYIASTALSRQDNRHGIAAQLWSSHEAVKRCHALNNLPNTVDYTIMHTSGTMTKPMH